MIDWLLQFTLPGAERLSSVILAFILTWAAIGTAHAILKLIQGLWRK